MDAAYDTFKPAFKTHHKKKYAEVEFRLGKINGNRFDPDVGKDSFNRLISALDTYKGWEKIESSEYSVYNGPDNFRCTIDENNDTREGMIKKRLINKNFRTNGMPFDLRMSISTETPQEETGDEVYESISHKKRKSYIRKGLRIDMTEVSGEEMDIDAENPVVYQVEFEILDPKNTNERSQLRNHIQKTEDLMKCLS